MRLVRWQTTVSSLAVAITCFAASSSSAQSRPPERGYVPNIRPPPEARSRTAPPRRKLQGAGGSTDIFPSAAEERLKAVKDCISFWDPGTHMSKTEWRKACTRTQSGKIF
jgi:hypothetical protein